MTPCSSLSHTSPRSSLRYRSGSIDDLINIDNNIWSKISAPTESAINRICDGSASDEILWPGGESIHRGLEQSLERNNLAPQCQHSGDYSPFISPKHACLRKAQKCSAAHQRPADHLNAPNSIVNLPMKTRGLRRLI